MSIILISVNGARKEIICKRSHYNTLSPTIEDEILSFIKMHLVGNYTNLISYNLSKCIHYEILNEIMTMKRKEEKIICNDNEIVSIKIE